MSKAASRFACRRRLPTFSRPCMVVVLCLAVLSAVTLFVIVTGNPQFAFVAGAIRSGETPEIAYQSSPSKYRQNARYVAALPRGNFDDNGREEVLGVFKPPPSQQQQQPPRGLHTRARRQNALEEEIHKYLAAHGIHRERRIRVRFVVVSNYFDWKLCATIGTAALGGYSIPVTGFDMPYSGVTRFTNYIEFADREGLDDDDIIVTMDGDIFWTGADFAPFLSKFARFSPEKEADLDVAAVRAWEDYGEKKAPLFMKELQAQAEATGGGANVKRPALQLPPIVTNAEPYCAWAQHSRGYPHCKTAYTVMEHVIEVARNHVSSYNASTSGKSAVEANDELRTKIAKMFPGATRWMMDDMLRQPNASSPYTSKAQRDRDDPFFYHVTLRGVANPTARVNTGMQVSRVWALKRLVKTMGVFAALEAPVPEEWWKGWTMWMSDQGMVGDMYTRARLFEVEHNLLSGPPLAARTPPLQYDLRFGPPGLIGVDRRYEMVVLGVTMKDFPELFHHSAYLNRSFPERGGSGANITEVHLGSDDSKGERLDSLSLSRGGALVTPPLLWRSATLEDRARGYENTAEHDPDVIYPPFIHYAGGWKEKIFPPQRHFYSWLVAARHDKQARQALNAVLREELMEVWYEKDRVFLDFLWVCRDPTELPLW